LPHSSKNRSPAPDRATPLSPAQGRQPLMLRRPALRGVSARRPCGAQDCASPSSSTRPNNRCSHADFRPPSTGPHHY
jgi:hypothetical protein